MKSGSCLDIRLFPKPSSSHDSNHSESPKPNGHSFGIKNWSGSMMDCYFSFHPIRFLGQKIVRFLGYNTKSSTVIHQKHSNFRVCVVIFSSVNSYLLKRKNFHTTDTTLFFKKIFRQNIFQNAVVV